MRDAKYSSVILGILILLGGTRPALAREVRVLVDGSKSYSARLGEALDAAAIGDVIVVPTPAGIIGLSFTQKQTTEQASQIFRGQFADDFIRAAVTPVVSSVIPGGPAARAGIKFRDRILAVDGRDVAPMTQMEVANLFRGTPGTTVRVRIATPDYSSFPARPAALYRLVAREVEVMRVSEFRFDIRTVDDKFRIAAHQSDVANAVRLGLPLAEAGLVAAQAYLCFAYTGAYGVARDDRRALDWCARAAAAGDAPAQRLLGLLYHHGRGTTRDDAEFVRWTRIAADHGDGIAMANLSNAHYQAAGVKSDSNLAQQWRQRAGLAGAYDLPLDAGPPIGRVANKVVANEFIQIMQGVGEARSARQPVDGSGGSGTAPVMGSPGPVVVVAAPAADASRAPAAAGPLGMNLVSAAAQPNAYALVIGVERYRDLPAPTGARQDAEQVARLLKTTFGVPEQNILLQLDERAARSDIDKQLRWLRQNVPPSGRVYFYFSGHGAPDPSTGTSYLVPYDGDPKFLSDTAIQLPEILKSLSLTKAHEVLAIVDSCFSGAGGRSVLPPGTRPLVKVQETRAVPRVALFAASSGSEISGPAKSGGGLFTTVLLQALGSGGADADGDGAVTLSELLSWVRPRVAREAKRDNREQTPQLVLGQGAPTAADFVLLQGLPGR